VTDRVACVSAPAPAPLCAMGRIVIVVGITAALAVLDLVGTILAKEWSDRRQHWLFAVGIACAVGLFVLLAVAVRYAEMSTVTLGWVVSMQVGLMLAEQFRYGIGHGADRWAAVVAMVALQVYLLMAPASSAG
jgi:multidrug transporter EmrE-like cation transporter